MAEVPTEAAKASWEPCDRAERIAAQSMAVTSAAEEEVALEGEAEGEALKMPVGDGFFWPCTAASSRLYTAISDTSLSFRAT